MGACCGGAYIDPEVEKCNSLQEIIDLFTKLKDDLPNEQHLIVEYLKDDTVQIPHLNIEGVSKKNLNKRIDYIVTVSEAYQTIIDGLKKHTKLNLQETKVRVSEVKRHYLKVFDDREDPIAEDVKLFKEFLTKNK